MKTSTLRLRSVQFKSGGSLRVLPQKADDIRAQRLDAMNNNFALMDAPMTGYIFIGWDETGSVCSFKQPSDIYTEQFSTLVQKRLESELITALVPK